MTRPTVLLVLALLLSGAGGTGEAAVTGGPGAPDPGRSVEVGWGVQVVKDAVALTLRTADEGRGATAVAERAATPGVAGPARAVDPHAPWSWPVPGQRVVHGFDPPRSPWGSGHRGVDIAAWAGAPVTAVAEGRVAFSGVIAGVGVVSVEHADGLRSTYQPVDDRAPQGSRVRTGQHLGVLASSRDHCVVLTCLHLGALRGPEDYVDPLALLRGWQLSLLPPHP